MDIEATYTFQMENTRASATVKVENARVSPEVLADCVRELRQAFEEPRNPELIAQRDACHKRIEQLEAENRLLHACIVELRGKKHDTAQPVSQEDWERVSKPYHEFMRSFNS